MYFNVWNIPILFIFKLFLNHQGRKYETWLSNAPRTLVSKIYLTSYKNCEKGAYKMVDTISNQSKLKLHVKFRNYFNLFIIGD